MSLENMKILGENKKIFVGMSGGIDSAVSAFLLQKKGYDVTGVFIKTWQPDYIECTWKNDRLDAMRICAELDIPFKTLDLEKEYKEHVIDYMLSEYRKNNIPNPDIMCNKYIKFAGFLNYAKENNAIIATGHYAKIENNFLVSAKDQSKDQSYFLYQIKKENLGGILFPLSDLLKSEVKQIAKDNNLYVAGKKESMGICMLGDISMKDFLIKELNPVKGDVYDERSMVIGTHDGVILYTVGERHGFSVIKKDKHNNSLPYFVYEKDFKNNVLYVTQDENKISSNNKINFQNGFVLKEVNTFIDINNINYDSKEKLENKIYKAQTRYHGELYDVRLGFDNVKKEIDTGGGYAAAQIKITPINNFSAIAGQSVVIYEGDRLLFGGIF